MKVKLPGSKTNEQSEPTKMIVTITSAGVIYAGPVQTTIDMLSGKLTEMRGVSDEGSLVIRADKTVQIDLVIKVIDRISLTDIHFRFGIEGQNPNSFDMDLKSLEYTVYFNDRQVGRGRLDKEVRIGKTSTTLVQVPLQTDFKSLGDPLGLVLSGQDLKYKIEGAAIVKASLGTATIPLSKTGEVRIKK